MLVFISYLQRTPPPPSNGIHPLHNGSVEAATISSPAAKGKSSKQPVQVTSSSEDQHDSGTMQDVNHQSAPAVSSTTRHSPSRPTCSTTEGRVAGPEEGNREFTAESRQRAAGAAAVVSDRTDKSVQESNSAESKSTSVPSNATAAGSSDDSEAESGSESRGVVIAPLVSNDWQDVIWSKVVSNATPATSGVHTQPESELLSPIPSVTGGGSIHQIEATAKGNRAIQQLQSRIGGGEGIASAASSDVRGHLQRQQRLLTIRNERVGSCDETARPEQEDEDDEETRVVTMGTRIPQQIGDDVTAGAGRIPL